MPDIAPLRNAAECAINDCRYRALPMLSIATLAGVSRLSLSLVGSDGAPMGLSLLGPAGSDRLLVKLPEALAATGIGR